MIVGYVTDFIEGGPFCPPPSILEQLQKDPFWIGLKAFTQQILNVHLTMMHFEITVRRRPICYQP